jgi:hypothetical protein
MWAVQAAVHASRIFEVSISGADAKEVNDFKRSNKDPRFLNYMQEAALDDE